MKALKRKPNKQSSNSYASGGTLVLESIKMYADKKRIDRVKLPPKVLAHVKRVKRGDIKAFYKILYPFTRINRLSIDSESEKLNLAKHARARNHCFNPVAKFIKRDDLVVEYGNKVEKKAAKRKTKKR